MHFTDESTDLGYVNCDDITRCARPLLLKHVLELAPEQQTVRSDSNLRQTQHSPRWLN
jgi:hypothetical protein